MKRYAKTALCITLTAAMLFTDTSITAFAQEERQQTEETWQEADAEETAFEETNSSTEEAITQEAPVMEETTKPSSEERASDKESTEKAFTEEADAEGTFTEEKNTESICTEEENTKSTFTENASDENTITNESTEENVVEDSSIEGNPTEPAESLTEATETESVSNEETMPEDGTDINIEETEMASEIETETETEESVDKFTFSGTDLPHGEYKENGSNITWAIDANGKLTVEGTGNISDAGSDSRSPWHEYRNDILSAEINVTGMTHAVNMFYGCSHLKEVDLSGLKTGKMIKMNEMFSGCNELTGLDLSDFDTSNVIDMYRMFHNCSSLTQLDLNGFDTGNVTSMTGMFSGCSSLTNLNVSSFNTSNVTSMSSMFQNCSSLTNLNVRDFNTSKVTSMAQMFWNCGSLSSLNLSNFHTDKVTDMGRMFQGCSYLTDLDLSNFDTNKVTNMRGMFGGCSVLSNLDISNFNTFNSTDMGGMFDGCSGLTSLDLSNFDTSNVANMQGMFEGCSSLTDLDISNFDTSSVVNMHTMFRDCSGLTSLDLSNFDTSSVTNMERMFDNCSGLESLNLSGFDMRKILPTEYIYFFMNGCSKLSKINTPRNVLRELSLPDKESIWYDGIGNQYEKLPQNLPHSILLTKGTAPETSTGYIAVSKKKTLYYVGDTVKDEDLTVVYYAPDAAVTVLNAGDYTTNVSEIKTTKEGAQSLTVSYNGMTAEIKLRISKGLGGIYTENGNNITWALDSDGNLTVEGTGDFAPKGSKEDRAPWFQYRTRIKSVKADIKGMTDAGYMFNGCVNLESVDLSGLDTGNVTTTRGMFQNCSNLEYLDLSRFVTDNVTSMESMFYKCSGLKKLNISGFNTGKVTDMGRMFSYCSSLTALDLSSFDTGNVQTMWAMFHQCPSLEQLNISGFNTSKVRDMHAMFGYCKSLTSLDLHGFDTHNVIAMDGLFDGCKNLTELNVSSFNTEKVKSMSSMFSGCESLTEIDLSGFDTHNVGIEVDGGGMQYLFSECSSLESLDLSSFDTRNVKNMFAMFRNCTNLKTLNISSFNTVEVQDMSDMFNGCRSLTSLDLSSFDMGRVTTVANTFGGMLQNCDALSEVYTARNLNLSVPLPSGEWQDMSGASYTNLPTELSYSILLAKDSKPEAGTEHITASKEKTVYYIGDTINTDDVTVRYYGKDGTVKILVSGFTTNASDLSMNTAGTKTLVVTYQQSMKAEIQLTVLEKEVTDKKEVNISGIKISDRTYNKKPASYTGTAKVVLKTNNVDVTSSVKLTYTYSGTQMNGSTYAASATAPVNAGNYKLTIAVAQDDKNYTGSVSYPFKITQAPLTITARDIGVKIGADLPKAEDYQYSTTGLLGDDKLLKEPVLNCDITDTAQAGTYDITITGADAGMNYSITYKNGTLTVNETGEITHYYTVTFNMNGHGTDTTSTGIEEGSLLEKPQDPQAEGYTFTGWYKDQSCTVFWDFAKDTIQSDTTVYAGWKANDDNKGDGDKDDDNKGDGDKDDDNKDDDNKDDNNDNYPADKDDSAFADAERTPLSAVSAAIANISARVYDGTAYEPVIKVTANINGKNTTLTEGIDYRVLYKDHIKAGTATVTIKGNGIYKGSVSKTYTISPRPVKKLKVITGSVAAAQTGTDTASLPVYVYDGAKRLSYNTDFTLTGYSAAGQTAQVTVTGKGNYTGSMTAKLSLYNVASDKLINPSNVGEIQPVSYNAGKAVKPEPVVTAGGAKLVKNKDYKVQYQNNKNAGTAFVIVTGKGAYRGKVVVPFTIKAAQGTSGMTVKSISAKTYNGKYQRPAPSVTVSISGKNKKLVKNKDYTVTYKNNRHAGTAEVLITGKGNYAGMTAKTTFTIKPQNITKAALKGTQGNLTLIYSKGILKQGTDYEQPIYGEVKKNKIKVTIKGKGDFTGTMQKSVKVQ